MSTTKETSIYSKIKGKYRKAYIPLESDPEIFTSLIHALGVSPSYEFTDVMSLDSELLSFIPRPVRALILVFPCSDQFEEVMLAKDEEREVYHGKGEDEPVVWFAQTIQNACGLYAILHSVANGIERSHIKPGSPLDELLKEVIPLAPEERVLALEASKAIENAHRAAGEQGGTAAPDAEAPTDYHYIAFVKSRKDGHIYDMNGTMKGPIDTGIVAEGEDLLEGGALKVVKEYIEQAGENVGFSLLALVPAQ